MFSKPKPENDQEVAQCPVCNRIFGKRDKAVIYKAHCPECAATFWWKPWADRPSVVMDKDITKERRYCSKSGCVCHD